VSAVIETDGLGKRYRRRWALTDCTLSVPAGHVVGLVGPNGAGKTTLLSLATGLLAPDAGTIEVLGGTPGAGPAQLARVGFLAQDAPVYARLSVADHLRLGARLNPGWDPALARGRVSRLDLDPGQRAGTLSGGQRAQLALTLAVAKRPELLVLDEPVASLDPLARREFLADLMEAVAEQDLSVVLSSHLIADLERVCDYLIVLVGSRVRVAGPVDELLAAHHLLSGPRRDPDTLPDALEVISASHTDVQTTLLVRTTGQILDPAWTVSQVGLEDLVLAYLSQGAGGGGGGAPPPPPGGGGGGGPGGGGPGGVMLVGRRDEGEGLGVAAVAGAAGDFLLGWRLELGEEVLVDLLVHAHHGAGAVLHGVGVGGEVEVAGGGGGRGVLGVAVVTPDA
jgi:ABC-2 type transport system ATP-binding protein